MADDTDDTLDERIQSIQRRAEGFRELLSDGDEVTIAYQDGGISVSESYRSKFERNHPKLFGRMLAIEAQMEPGYFPYFAGLMLAGAFLFGLHLSWWDGVIGAAASTLLQGWWFPFIAVAVILYLARLGCKRWQKFVYRRNRQTLLDLIVAEKLARDVLLVNLRFLGEVDNLLYQIKLDTTSEPS
jgi:hypothetical protein